MNLLVIGSGYVGLVTGACFAEMGHHVTCLDLDQKKLELLKQGKVPIYEPGLEELLVRNTKAGRLSFSDDYAAVKEALICFICVSTPQGKGGEADLSYIKSAARSISEQIDDYKIIVNKSTVPVGTGNLVREIIAESVPDSLFAVLSNPEFLKEGDAVNDFLKPDRVVIGSDSEKASKIMQQLYRPFMLNTERLLLMDVRSAELTKYAANSMLAARVSFMNEIAGISELVGADIQQVRLGIGSDSRIGKKFLYPGVGFGGSCFPKDIRALRKTADEVGFDTPFLDAIELVNQRQKRVTAEKIAHYFSTRGGNFGKVVAIWGLAFKPNTDDMREAPALVIIHHLLHLGFSLRLFDPVSMDNAKDLLKGVQNITFCSDEFSAAQGADAVALITEWRQFRFLDFEHLKRVMKGRVIFDGRNQYSPSEMRAKGFDYFSIGREAVIEEKDFHLDYAASIT